MSFNSPLLLTKVDPHAHPIVYNSCSIIPVHNLLPHISLIISWRDIY